MSGRDVTRGHRIGAVVLVLVAGTLIGACSSSTDQSMPAYRGDNGKIAHGDVKPWFATDALSDWTTKPDFVAVASVESQRRLDDLNPELGSDPEFWNAIQDVSISDVLWRRSDGIGPPDSLKLIGSGWSRNNDTGEVSPLVPAEGARLDVGDEFVAAFVNVSHFLEPDEVRSYVAQMGTEWATLGDAGVLHLDEQGRIVTNDRTPEYEKNLDGLSVGTFTERLLATTSSPGTTTSTPD